MESITSQRVIEIISQAPMYQEIPLHDDDHDLVWNYLVARNKTVKRYPDVRGEFLIDQLEGQYVVDLGCEVGYFGHTFVDEVEHYIGIDSDGRCIDAATALVASRQHHCLDFIHADIIGWLDENRHAVRFDIAFYTAVHHHIIGNHGYDKSHEVLQMISEMSNTMFFEMGQKNESNNESRSYWHDALPDTDPLEFILSQVLTNSDYTNFQVLMSRPRFLIKFTNPLAELLLPPYEG